MPKKTKFRSDTAKDGHTYTYPINTSSKPKKGLSRQSSIPMMNSSNLSSSMPDENDMRANLIAGMPMMGGGLPRTTSQQARRNELILGIETSGPSASALGNRSKFLGGMSASPFIMGYGAIPHIGGAGGGGGRIDTSGPHRVGKTMNFYGKPLKPQKKAEKPKAVEGGSGITRGVYTESWDRKNPPRHLVKAGQVGVFNNDKQKRYAILSKSKAIAMVEKHMTEAVAKKFKQRITDKSHSTYVDWEIHTSNKKLQRLFGI